MAMTIQQSINRLMNLTASLRAQDSEMTIAALQVLLMIARKPGISSKEILKDTGLSQSSVSRYMALLTDSTNLRRMTSGYGFVETRPDPADARNKVAYLTLAGRNFVAQQLGIVYPDEALTASDLPLK